MRDLFVLKLMPFCDQNFRLCRRLCLEVKEDRSLISLGNDRLCVKAHRYRHQSGQRCEILVGAPVCLKKSNEYKVVAQIFACGSEVSLYNCVIEGSENLSRT